MRQLYIYYLIIGIILIIIGIIIFGGNNKSLIVSNNPIKYYEDNQNSFQITKLNYSSLELYYDSDTFKKCYESIIKNNNFLSCNNLFGFSNTYNFANNFLEKGDEGKFLLGCLLKEHGNYYDCFCKYAKSYRKCTNYDSNQ